jgi:asparagine synthase (glutamine-hydrolysing)
VNGRFHALLADRRRGTATLLNDRYGLHRIYYHESRDAFYFAAEAKAILAVRPELRRADMQGLGEFVSCGCVLDNRTIFQGVNVLPPGSAWTFRQGAIEKKSSYFCPREWEEQGPLSPEPYYQQLVEVFSRNLPRYFCSREPIALSLTGGLDTRMILAWKKLAPRSLPCYTFGGIFRDCHDVRVARKVAKLCQQDHQVIRVGDEFLSGFPQYAERTVYMSDGCASVMHAANLYTNRQAREIAPVRMTGNYGGDVLRRIRPFKPQDPAPGLFHPGLLTYVERTKETYAEALRTHPLSFTVFRQVPWHHYSLFALEDTQLAVRTPYLDNDFVRTVFRAPESACVSKQLCLRLIGDGDTALRSVATDRGCGGNGGRISAALSRNLLEFTFKGEYAYDYGMPQWVAATDHLLSGLHLERLFLGRHKFYHYRVWYRDQLSKYVREMLLDSRTLSRPYLDRNTVEFMVNRHLRGDRNYTTAIHQLLTLELIHRLFLDSGTSFRQETN